MILNSLKYFTVLILTLSSLSVSHLYGQETIKSNPVTTNFSHIKSKLKTGKDFSVFSSRIILSKDYISGYNYVNDTIDLTPKKFLYAGIGYLYYLDYKTILLNLNYVTNIQNKSFLNLGIDYFKSFNYPEDPPGPAVNLLIYHYFQINEKNRLLLGGGFTYNFFYAFGITLSAREDYSFSRNFAIGIEIKYTYNKIDLYKYPIGLINFSLKL